MLESLEKMLARGTDNALLRFGLGKGYLSFYALFNCDVFSYK